MLRCPDNNVTKTSEQKMLINVGKTQI